MNQETMQLLCKPFPFEEIETKVQTTNADKSKGLAVFFLDSRSVQERLDKTLGAFGWRNEYIAWQQKAQLCGLSLYDNERGAWVTKYDGAENSDIEAVKGGLTDAFKRSAVTWGIGRYLYKLDGIWVDVEQRGKGCYIKDNQQGKLKAEYDKAVAKIFGGSVADPAPAKPASAKPAAAGNTAQQAPPAKQDTTPGEYKVHSVKPSGKSSQLLELIDGGGEVVAAYVKNGDHTITAGARLQKVQMERKSSSYGDYNLINAYQLAA